MESGGAHVLEMGREPQILGGARGQYGKDRARGRCGIAETSSLVRIRRAEEAATRDRRRQGQPKGFMRS